jgi:Replication-relaxation
MQLLVGMLDAALARQQDLVAAEQRVTVALKVDEAPLVLNRGFAETMALKRSAGLETVACWQTDAQWTDREVAEQLDALFAHRVYFATASARDARAAVKLMMAEFSDTVRPGIQHLSALGHPDVRLHLPKHHALASWVTPEGRQAPFLARTIPLQVDHDRIALHAARQRERGGRPLTEMRQPHWQRAAEARASDTAAAPPSPPVTASSEAASPGTPAESHAELVELDRAYSVRWAKPLATPVVLEPDQLDLEVLALVASLRHVLTTQVHRRFNPTRSLTTTQRRLKRLSDAGLLARFQFYRRDGGGVPMCYVITDAGRRAVTDAGRLDLPHAPADAAGAGAGGARRDLTLRQARHEVHVAAWVLALGGLIGYESFTVLGPEQAVLSPPKVTRGQTRVALGAQDLRLPGGRTPHDFLFTDASGEPVEVERFETIRPDAILEVAPSPSVPTPGPEAQHSGNGVDSPGRAPPVAGPQPRAVDLVIERDDRFSSGRWLAKLERYDHFLAGWSLHTPRYGQRRGAPPVVVFVCRDSSRARDCARRADLALRACRAYAGEYPFDWEYPGRERVLFVSERDVHEGLLRAHGTPRVPPAVRVGSAHGDPRVGEATVEPRTLPVTRT